MISNTPHPAGLVELFQSFWRHRQLILRMSKRDVIGRYSGSMMGLAWSFFNPLLMLTIYTFVFSVVFNSRWEGGGDEGKTRFAVLLFVGMIMHGLFAECVNRAPTLILTNVNYVKKVVFPLEILPWVAFCSALFHAAISLAVLLLAQLIFDRSLACTVLLFPLVLLPLMLATMGFAWFIASFGVYVRDVGQITAMFTTVLLFMSGVFYPISALPAEYQGWMQLNPLAFIIEESRNVLVLGRVPDPARLAVATLGGLAVAWLGFAWFQGTRRGFSDVV